MYRAGLITYEVPAVLRMPQQWVDGGGPHPDIHPGDSAREVHKGVQEILDPADIIQAVGHRGTEVITS